MLICGRLRVLVTASWESSIGGAVRPVWQTAHRLSGTRDESLAVRCAVHVADCRNVFVLTCGKRGSQLAQIELGPIAVFRPTRRDHLQHRDGGRLRVVELTVPTEAATGPIVCAVLQAAHRRSRRELETGRTLECWQSIASPTCPGDRDAADIRGIAFFALVDDSVPAFLAFRVIEAAIRRAPHRPARGAHRRNDASIAFLKLGALDDVVVEYAVVAARAMYAIVQDLTGFRVAYGRAVGANRLAARVLVRGAELRLALLTGLTIEVSIAARDAVLEVE